MSQCISADYCRGWNDAVDEMPRWISVKERLPEKGQKVAFIPTCNQRSVYIGEISHVSKNGRAMFENKFSRTTMKYYANHWMPLPELPKEPEA